MLSLFCVVFYALGEHMENNAGLMIFGRRKRANPSLVLPQPTADSCVFCDCISKVNLLHSEIPLNLGRRRLDGRRAPGF